MSFTQYVGNPDYRGYIAYQQQNNSQDPGYDYLSQLVGNDAQFNPDALNTFVNARPSSDVGYDARQYITDFNNKTYQDYLAAANGGGGTGTSTPIQTISPDDIAFFDDQDAQLKSLLGRTDTGLQQGLTQNQNEYDRNVGGANEDKQRQYANYQDQRVAQNKGKVAAQDTNNRNANTGFRSLAQIIGRAAGTGSSAFRDLLPNIVGTDLSGRQRQVAQNFGQNIAGIDKAQGQYDISFQGVLDDLLRQKKENEDKLRSGIETQRQNINNQLAENAGKRAQAFGGGYAAVKAAQDPYRQAIENSKNAVENFFNQFQTPYTARQAVATAPELSGYTTDRATLNAQNQGLDSNNPYSTLLRKRLQGLA